MKKARLGNGLLRNQGGHWNDQPIGRDQTVSKFPEVRLLLRQALTDPAPQMAMMVFFHFTEQTPQAINVLPVGGLTALRVGTR